ncbi:MAG TPA: endonuclease/exonuclease/phosphatase family protein [Actinophytocola sp.]|uniref:endonuclease/exonuclease/phosphatase family protein n=1 Tax=Actinophytocola sp. TaxID=1872138 RepID=UPI002DBAB8AE|nr:endonuclease/exonuclease/phosphatase family protein [Actinophytocola sp.]HEU5473690.1 endonuclease/exonuclease/phosphatase family protein [Actinophytocola sp.]
MRVRVATINVQNDEGDPRRTGLLNRALRDLDPDVVVLQEVCYPDRRDQLAELTAGTGLAHTTHEAAVLTHKSTLADRFGGMAVATRWPHRVLDTVQGRRWWTLAVELTVADLGQALLITPCTPWQLDAAAARERQVLEIADLDQRHRRALPTIIAGDFNAAPDTAGIRFLSGLQSLDGHSVHYHDAWAVAGDGPGHTWSTDNPLAAAQIDLAIGQPGHRRRIDYIFVGSWHAHPTTQARITTAQLFADQPVDHVWLSDHVGVTADLDVTPDLPRSPQ